MRIYVPVVRDRFDGGGAVLRNAHITKEAAKAACEAEHQRHHRRPHLDRADTPASPLAWDSLDMAHSGRLEYTIETIELED